jgi:adenylate kinase
MWMNKLSIDPLTRIIADDLGLLCANPRHVITELSHNAIVLIEQADASDKFGNNHQVPERIDVRG